MSKFLTLSSLFFLHYLILLCEFWLALFLQFPSSLPFSISLYSYLLLLSLIGQIYRLRDDTEAKKKMKRRQKRIREKIEKDKEKLKSNKDLLPGQGSASTVMIYFPCIVLDWISLGLNRLIFTEFASISRNTQEVVAVTLAHYHFLFFSTHQLLSFWYEGWRTGHRDLFCMGRDQGPYKHFRCEGWYARTSIVEEYSKLAIVMFVSSLPAQVQKYIELILTLTFPLAHFPIKLTAICHPKLVFYSAMKWSTSQLSAHPTKLEVTSTHSVTITFSFSFFRMP